MIKGIYELTNNKKFESLTKKLPHKKVQDHMTPLIISTKYLKKNKHQNFKNYSNRYKQKEYFQTYFHVIITLIPKPDKDTTKKVNLRLLNR